MRKTLIAATLVSLSGFGTRRTAVDVKDAAAKFALRVAVPPSNF
ncbi:MAG: hypothetical protein ABI120_23690 [Gemmatimonadaceae bacterium]